MIFVNLSATIAPSVHLLFISLLILVLPLVSALAIVVIGSKKVSSWLGTMMMTATFLLTVYVFLKLWGVGDLHQQWNWFTLDSNTYRYSFKIGLLADQLSLLLLLVVSLISLLVHLYSVVYMKQEEGLVRYYAVLGFFTFSMLGIVLADNLLIIFIFWELVGFSSYLLVGFWHKKEEAAKAAKKGFIINRIGDAGFLVGIMILWSVFGTLDLPELRTMMGNSFISGGNWVSYLPLKASFLQIEIPALWLTLAGLGLFCGTVGKSAQFPLQIWLPDAMQGPTPVSALIHAATMVAAGVYLLARVFVLLNTDSLTVIAFVGAATAFMAAIAAVSQYDIKKVLAYSTISQLGFMVMGIGVGAYDAAIFHLITHAFFKACLFLTAGSVIYAIHRLEQTTQEVYPHIHWATQDLRLMGGLRKKLPYTFTCFAVAAAAIAGLPGFSGFLSKDAILTGAMAWSSSPDFTGNWWLNLVLLLGFAAAILTVIYMFRLMVLTFFGEMRLPLVYQVVTEKMSALREVPLLMLLPPAILAACSIGVVFSLNPFQGAQSWVMQGLAIPLRKTPGLPVSLQTNLAIGVEDWHSTVSWMSIGIFIGGLAIAWRFYHPGGRYASRYHLALEPQGFMNKLSFHHWYLDQFYTGILARAAVQFALLTAWMDQQFIDRILHFTAKAYVVFAHILHWFERSIVDGIIKLTAYLSSVLGRLLGSIQGGRIQSYFIISLLGILLLILWRIF